MILECDIGNTCTKWRLLEDGRCFDSGVLNTVDRVFQGLPIDSAIDGWGRT
jgi:pantothenate kinase type III